MSEWRDRENLKKKKLIEDNEIKSIISENKSNLIFRKADIQKRIQIKEELINWKNMKKEESDKLKVYIKLFIPSNIFNFSLYIVLTL